jgi:hypothetical protein
MFKKISFDACGKEFLSCGDRMDWGGSGRLARVGGLEGHEKCNANYFKMTFIFIIC